MPAPALRVTFPLLLSCITVNAFAQPIDRHALVTRHNIHITQPDKLNSLSVGNGEFAYTVDISGLQSFPEYYETGVPLGTQSQWGWHSMPNDQHYQLKDVYQYDTSRSGRVTPFPVEFSGGRKGEATKWLRGNPHRLHLGLIGLVLLTSNGQEASIDDLQQVDQQLDLWTGKIVSKYTIEGVPVTVELYSHQEKDQIAARITSPLIRQGRLKVFFKFPYGSDKNVGSGADWGSPDKHETVLLPLGKNYIQLERHLDSTTYYTVVQWTNEAQFLKKDKHHFELVPSERNDVFEVNVLFSKTRVSTALPGFKETQANNVQQWKKFWTTGGAIDFSGSTDARAAELERRVILSQYVTKVNCAGSMPPQETGLVYNSWYGRPHLEMHWWHGVHFALWGRTDLLEKSLPWYNTIISKAKELAESQGYKGIRWPKMTDPSGGQGPSKVSPYLIWQQPHIIYLAELIYRQKPNKATLDKYKDLIFPAAEFMASFPEYSREDGYYHLNAPLKTAQELWAFNETNDPIFELSYWRLGLSIAQNWRKRLGLKPDQQWQDIIDHLAPLPRIADLYYPIAGHPDAYMNAAYRRLQPIVLATLGFLPLSDKVDTAIMKNTLKKVLDTWNWETTWGVDYPMIAMNAARLGMPETAVDILMKDLQKNTYLANGYNYQDDRLRIYLPGNGGLLTAVAMMAAGWDGCPDIPAPGFPKNGKWKVKWEGLHVMP